MQLLRDEPARAVLAAQLKMGATAKSGQLLAALLCTSQPPVFDTC